ncbi:uncharacterized protein LOC112084578 [Eutrema salsugineum]|uniref:uncharacterized protein LOC112084578 n=1 Tax=Eutrema salsugineum TaxID=72664 RepID=UPI000CED0D8D|nr:uncharacterized protein LOC112084578 [Eutrema salsugineum]
MFPKKYCDRTVVDNIGFPHYMRRQTDDFVEKNGIRLDNSWVVPYNKKLSLRYRAHINVKWCTQARSIKYLFKYIHKGPDRVLATIENNAKDIGEFANEDGDEASEVTKDEIREYFECRYVSACKASWRILAFAIHYRSFPVEKLYFHLPGEQPFVYGDDDPVETVLNRRSVQSSMLLAFFEACDKYPELSKNLTYAEFPIVFIYDRKEVEWRPRQKIDKVLYPTFKDACYALGLLDDDTEYIEALKEASIWGSGSFLRKLFAVMLITDSILNPCGVWNETWQLLLDDIIYRRRRLENREDLTLSEDQLKNYTLDAIEIIMRSNGSSLAYFDGMPLPSDGYHNASINRLLFDERNYDKDEMSALHNKMLPGLTEEQMKVYSEIMEAVTLDQGQIVLNVASSGIAALLLPGGRTTHSQFGIPSNPDELSTCNMHPGSDLATLVAEASLIIWDEAPMMSKFCFESLDRSMRDVIPRHKDKLFGGKVVVFGGDFRQVLPVITGGGREDITRASLCSSYLWDEYIDASVAEEIKSFSEWILRVGDGKVNLPNTGEIMIDMPEELLITECNEPIKAIVESVYGLGFEEQNDPNFFQERAILCPTNDDVCAINDYMMSALRGAPVMLLRNIDPNSGLCNGTRLQVTQLADHIIEAIVLTGHTLGQKVYIPRLSVSPPEELSLKQVLIVDKEGNPQKQTMNVVFKEIFQKLIK